MKIPNYISLEEKCNVFKNRYRVITTTTDFLQWHEEHKIRRDYHHIFRGVKDASFKNYTSAQRYYFRSDLRESSPQDLVQEQLNTLRKSNGELLARYCDNFDIPCSDLFLLSFAQHYGGISPLLDFSPIEKTALFFMTWGTETPLLGEGSSNAEDLRNYMSIYYLPKRPKSIPNIASMLSSTIDVMRPIITITEKTPFSYWQKMIDNDSLKLFSYPLLRSQWSAKPIIIDGSQVIYSIKNNRFIGKVYASNLNLTAQQGCFVYSDIGVSPLEKELYCVDVHKSLAPFIRKEILGDFYTRDMMFPSGEQIVLSALNEAMINIAKNSQDSRGFSTIDNYRRSGYRGELRNLFK